MRQWRLLVDEATHGAMNMARDEAILKSVSAKAVLPTLRLYAWSPFCLSLGYGQSAQEADEMRLAQQGWGIVRRPTGGKAILHGDELTYSLSLPIDDPLAQGDVVASYRLISLALIEALGWFGIAPQAEPTAKGNQGLGAVCFEVPSHYEITVLGKKLIGSAQVRRKEGILQHGTLPLEGDIARICDSLHYTDDTLREQAKQHVRERAITLSEALGRIVSLEQAQEALINGFERAFNVTFTLETLTDQENADTAHFLAHYQDLTWTYKR